MARHGRWSQAQTCDGFERSHPAREPLEVLARMMDLGDPYTLSHSIDVAELVPRVGETLGIDGLELEELELAARFHDVGKAAVPVEVLAKPGPLDAHERRLMACHVEWGAAMLRQLPACDAIARIVRHHHERYDGCGYPDGLRDGQIPLASRIIAACDAYGAMITDRPYRHALDADTAVDELEAGAGSQFDPTAVDALLRALNGDRTTN